MQGLNLKKFEVKKIVNTDFECEAAAWILQLLIMTEAEWLVQ